MSTDGGTTWNTTTAVTGSSTGFTWQYVWPNPALGSYTIMSRATDGLGNVETPAAGVAVTIVSSLPSFTVATGGMATTNTTTTTVGATTTPSSSSSLPYVNPSGSVQIKADITYLQQQLLVLLQQLVALLRAGH